MEHIVFSWPHLSFFLPHCGMECVTGSKKWMYAWRVSSLKAKSAVSSIYLDIPSKWFISSGGAFIRDAQRFPTVKTWGRGGFSPCIRELPTLLLLWTSNHNLPGALVRGPLRVRVKEDSWWVWITWISKGKWSRLDRGMLFSRKQRVRLKLGCRCSWDHQWGSAAQVGWQQEQFGAILLPALWKKKSLFLVNCLAPLWSHDLNLGTH
jgi:hypothetical protein